MAREPFFGRLLEGNLWKEDLKSFFALHFLVERAETSLAKKSGTRSLQQLLISRWGKLIYYLKRFSCHFTKVNSKYILLYF